MNKPHVGIVEHPEVERVFNFIKDDLHERLKSFKGLRCTKEVIIQISKAILDFCHANLDKLLYDRIQFDIVMDDPEKGQVQICPRNLVTGMFIVGVPIEFLMLVKDDCKGITVKNTGTEFDGCKFRYTVSDGFSINPNCFVCFDRKEENDVKSK